MKRRPRRSVPATITALALTAAGALVAVVSVQMILGHEVWVDYGAVARRLHESRWADPLVVGAGAVVAVAGFLLLAAAVLPGRPVVLPVRGELDSGASRRSFGATLRAAATRVDGVDSVRLKLRRRTVRVRATTRRTRPDGIADSVRAAVASRLDQIDPVRRPDVRVRLRTPRSTS
ncbi:DUF6286 domain-containing protein [Amycolatopsis sp. OK19-0408]|uniref:DUF6286 domain-containing protein n=1 Tax=Amycolatopsis iheyensis TaxID=2945988 RepID=A0A9X2SIC7_9PSEU|nr:DUF6286 domain-containing protein [Amycolatopsis iheyensis]MCR6482798.1 DUF6286 domain-containing protein [Amycolatopsis iheyensis]